MNQEENNENVRLLPAGTVSRDVSLVERHRQRQDQQQGQFAVEKPERIAPDETSWFGKRRESSAVRRHNQQIDAIESAEGLSEYALRLGLRLEVVGVSESARTITSEVDVFRGMQPNSLESTLVQELLLDSVDRIRQLVSQSSEQFRRKALG